MINLSNILQANKNIENKINKTPLVKSPYFENNNIYYKPEILQKTNSFKIRGVLNKLHSLSATEKEKGLIAFSAGSHALSLAFVASQEKIPVTVVLPKATSQYKIKQIASFGANIILAENIKKKCQELKQKNNLTLIHPFDDPYIIAGQGTIGLEIMGELPLVDTVVVPIGGGGLIAGIAIALKSLKPQIKIIGVEPTGSCSMFNSIKFNKIEYISKSHSIADCLLSPSPGKITFNYVKKFVDEIILVSDEQIVESLKNIWHTSQLKTEPSGAISLAPILCNKMNIPNNSNIVCILSGANISKKNIKKMV